VHSNVRPDRPDVGDSFGLSDELWDLARRCWQKDPIARPTAGVLCDDMKHCVHNRREVPAAPPALTRDTTSLVFDNHLPASTPCVRLEPTPSVLSPIQSAGRVIQPALAYGPSPIIDASASIGISQTPAAQRRHAWGPSQSDDTSVGRFRNRGLPGPSVQGLHHPMGQGSSASNQTATQTFIRPPQASLAGGASRSTPPPPPLRANTAPLREPPDPRIVPPSQQRRSTVSTPSRRMDPITILPMRMPSRSVSGNASGLQRAEVLFNYKSKLLSTTSQLNSF